MRLLNIILVLMLVGCSTVVPVTAKFPDVPERLLVKCPQLEKLNNESKLSDITAYRCSIYNL